MKYSRLFGLVIFLLMSGCTTFKRVNLSSESLESNASQYSTGLIASIDAMNVSSNGYEDASEWEQGLRKVLSKSDLFRTVPQSYKNKENIDIIVRGEVNGKFRPNGAKNFFTWWPGAIIFAHNWRGTQYTYDAVGNRTSMNEDSDGDGTIDKQWSSNYETTHHESGWDLILGKLDSET